MTDPTQPDYTPPAAQQPAPGYPAPAYPGAAAAPAPVPGRGLAITGFVLAFLLPLIGMIISIIATVKLGKIGAPRGLSIAGIIIGAILTVLWIVIAISVAAAVFGGLAVICSELGPGVWDVDGVTYTCG
ncbi:putative lipid-binding transport protein (Tim44 family) [Microbacterium sp. ZKA21]|uniref:DUF4190 domain-containing protein n=1 Tax=Microbacterium sp. ZKA21 TaxID=3381694 RepID=UPI003D1ED983